MRVKFIGFHWCDLLQGHYFIGMEIKLLLTFTNSLDKQS